MVCRLNAPESTSIIWDLFLVWYGPGLFQKIGVFQRSNSSVTMIWCEFLWFPIGQSLVRMSLPAKPNLSNHNLGGDDDYAELSSRFKGSHVKILLWWLTMETRIWADATPNDPSQTLKTLHLWSFLQRVETHRNIHIGVFKNIYIAFHSKRFQLFVSGSYISSL